MIGILNKKKNQKRVWLSGCPHTPADKLLGRDAISIAISQIDANWKYDYALMMGDFETDQNPPTIASRNSEGLDCVSQLSSSLKYHRSHIYTLAGNHDGGDANMDWFLHFIDPLGSNTAVSGVNSSNFPRPIVLREAGAWDAYYVNDDTCIFLMLSDRNDLPYPWGRGGSAFTGGHPSGAITLATWTWAKNIILNNSDKNIFICTHINPRFTTIATPDGDRACGNHSATGIAAGSGSLYSIYDEDTQTADDATTQFLDFFSSNPNHTVVAWFGAHTHTTLGQTCGTGSRSIHWTENGVKFLNVGNLTKFHGGTFHPKSWALTIANGIANFKMFIHDTNSGQPIGFYKPEEFSVNLKV